MQTIIVLRDGNGDVKLRLGLFESADAACRWREQMRPVLERVGLEAELAGFLTQVEGEQLIDQMMIDLRFSPWQTESED